MTGQAREPRFEPQAGQAPGTAVGLGDDGSTGADHMSEVGALREAAGDTPEGLPDGVAGALSDGLGADLSDVRIHRGPAAAAKAEAHEARAVTEGRDIHFAPGEYDPGTHRGLHLLAHEAAHVVQQGGGNATGAQAKRRDGGGGGAHEEDADRAADAVVARSRAPATALVAAPARAQRKGIDPGGDFASIRRRLDTLRAELQVATRERAAFAEGAQAAQLGGAAVGRAIQELQTVIAPLAAQVAPVRNTFIPVASKILGAALYLSVTNGKQDPRYFSLAGLLKGIFGVTIKPLLDDGKLDLGGDDRKTAILEALDGAAAALGGGKISPAALGKLAAASRMLEDVKQHSAREELRPKVEAVTELVYTASDAASGTDTARELLIRMSLVRELVHLQPIVRETIGDLRGEQRDDARGYGKQQEEEFQTQAGRVQRSIGAQFEHRRDAVYEIERESEKTESPKKSTIWHDLAFAALKGIISGVVEHGLAKIDPKVALVLKTAVIPMADVLIERAWSKAWGFDEEAPELPERRGREDRTGGGESKDFRIAFFGAQKRTLVQAALQADDELLGQLAATKARLGEDPKALIDGLAALAEALRSPKAIDEVMDKQRMKTTAGWSAALVRGQLGGGHGLFSFGKGPESDMGGVLGTKEGWSEGNVFSRDVVGLINVSFSGHDPAEPVRVQGAWVKGLNPNLRERLEKMQLASLAVPLRARGQVVLHQGGHRDRGYVTVARNETGEVWHSQREVQVGVTSAERFNHWSEIPHAASAWLAKKGLSGRDSPGIGRVDLALLELIQAMEHGAARIIEEIGGKSLVEHGVSLTDMD